MGDFNHEHIGNGNLYRVLGLEDQRCLNFIQDSFLSQHVLEPTI